MSLEDKCSRIFESLLGTKIEGEKHHNSSEHENSTPDIVDIIRAINEKGEYVTTDGNYTYELRLHLHRTDSDSTENENLSCETAYLNREIQEHYRDTRHKIPAIHEKPLIKRKSRITSFPLFSSRRRGGKRKYTKRRTPTKKRRRHTKRRRPTKRRRQTKRRR